MALKNSVIYVLMLFSLTIQIFGEEVSRRFLSLGTDEGLVHSAVQDVIRDGSGLLWFATPQGLQRYLPHSSLVIKTTRDNPDGLKTNNFLRIIQDASHTIWATTDRGLVMVDPLTGTTENRPGGLSSLSWLGELYISDIAEDPDEGLWLGVGDYGLVYYNPILDDGWGFPLSGAVRALTPADDEESSMFFILDHGRSGDLYKVIRGVRPPIRILQWPGQDREPTALEWLGEDLLLIGFSDGSMEEFVTSSHIPRKRNTPAPGRITDFQADEAGGVWVGTDKAGAVYVSADGRLSLYEPYEGSGSIADGVITKMFHDDEGMVWFATRNNGVSMTNPELNHFRVLIPPVDEAPVSAVFYDSRGVLWLGTDGGGLFGYNSALDLEYSFSEDQLGDSSILSIVEKQPGELWLGTFQGGLVQLEVSSGSVVRYRNNIKNSKSIPSDFIRDIALDPDGRVWLASIGGGIAVLPNPLSSDFRQMSNLPLSFTSLAVWQDSLFAGGPGTGLYLISGEDYGARQISGLASSDVWDMVIDQERGILWVATGLGLEAVSLESTQIIQTGLPEILRDAVLVSVGLDDAGGLWVTSHDQVVYHHPENEVTKVFGPEHGVQIGSFLIGAGVVAQDVYVWGGTDGVALLDRATRGSLALQGESIETGESSYPRVVVMMGETDEMFFLGTGVEKRRYSLGPGSSALRFRVQLLDYFSAAEQNLYFRLVGLDDEWQQVLSSGAVVYANLEGGVYTLQVRTGSSLDTDPGMSIQIEVAPPFWTSRWFTVFMILALLAIPVGIVIYRTNRLRSFNQQLAKRVRDRTEELHQSNVYLQQTVKQLRQAQDRLIRTERLGALRSLTSGIAHEMNTPAGVLITATSYLESELQVVDALVDQGNLTRTGLNLFLKATRDTTEILQRNLLRLNRLIEEFRSVSVTEHLELSPRQFLLEQTIEMAAQRSGYASTGHRIDLQLPKGLKLRSYESAFEELFRQLFLNTLQHGFANKRTGEGLVTITGFIQEPYFYLTFQDNGDGLIEGVRPRIFDPFYTTKRIEGATGLGMYILFNLVREVLHGDVSCEPSDGFLLICSFETDQLFGEDLDVHQDL